jgi:hypothetical protein
VRVEHGDTREEEQRGATDGVREGEGQWKGRDDCIAAWRPLVAMANEPTRAAVGNTFLAITFLDSR